MACTSDGFAPNHLSSSAAAWTPDTVMGRVARHITDRGDEGKIQRDERSQKLKYHIQTSVAAYAQISSTTFAPPLQALVTLRQLPLAAPTRLS
jgi:hypothetical protein